MNTAPDISATIPATVSLAVAARRLGLLAVTVRACIKGAILQAVDAGAGEYYIAEDELKRFAGTVGITLAPVVQHSGGRG